MPPRYDPDQTEHPGRLCSPVRDVDVRLVGVAAVLAQRHLARTPLAVPRDLGSVFLELVEEDVEPGTLELFLELVVRVLDIAVEVALDDVRRALRRLLGVGELVRLNLREARRQFRLFGQGTPGAGGLHLLAEFAFFTLLLAPTAATGDEQGEARGNREQGQTAYHRSPFPRGAASLFIRRPRHRSHPVPPGPPGPPPAARAARDTASS